EPFIEAALHRMLGETGEGEQGAPALLRIVKPFEPQRLDTILVVGAKPTLYRRANIVIDAGVELGQQGFGLISAPETIERTDLSRTRSKQGGRGRGLLCGYRERGKGPQRLVVAAQRIEQRGMVDRLRYQRRVGIDAELQQAVILDERVR